MSDNIPFDIQVEIIKRVHLVESLIRFRSVSKKWKSLIDSSEFITHHIVNKTQPQHLLVRYKEASECKYVLVVDDDSFPQNKFVPTVPPTGKLVQHVVMLDSSHGLVCLFGCAPEDTFSVVLWNPSIRKSVGIVLPFGSHDIGFGVCPKTCDPTIVAITQRRCAMRPVDWEAQVFTLSSMAWRSVSMNLPMPFMWVGLKYPQVLIDGVIHWLLYDWITGCSEMIISFDLTSEEFGQVHLPDSLAHTRNIYISKCKESLVLLYHHEYEEICDVWMMTKNGDFECSFAKLYTVSFQAYDGCELYGIIGFTKDGQPIRMYQHPSGSDDDSTVKTLEACEPSTQSSRDLGIVVGLETEFKMTSYKESLLLLNHSDSVIEW